MPSIVSIYLMHAGCVLHLLNRTDCYVWLYQKNLWMFMLEMHLISGKTDGWQGCKPHRPPAKRNVTTGPLPSLYFGICYSFHFSTLFFLGFSDCFPVISGFCIVVQYRIWYCFFTIFWVLASGLPSVKFPLLKPYCIWSKLKVVLQIRATCRATSSILQ